MSHFTLAAFRTDLDHAFAERAGNASSSPSGSPSSSKSSASASSSERSQQPFDPSCTFCAIAAQRQSAHVLYEDENTIAFLDILPLRRGHTLVVPKAHYTTVSDLPPSQAAHLAHTVTRLTRGISRAFDDPRLQVITNQVYAQVVPHVHYHIVPAPPLSGVSSDPSSSSSGAGKGAGKGPGGARVPPDLKKLWASIGHGRTELEDDEAARLVERIRAALQQDTEYEQAVAAADQQRSKL